MKKKLIIALSFALLLIPLIALKAADTKSGDSIYIAKDEIVSGNLYAAGKTITIDGVISGDLIAAAQTIIVNGQVEGDIIIAAQTINISGVVGGNIRAAGSSITLNSTVARNINLFASDISIGNQSRIGWDALLMATNIQMRGNINGGLSGGASQLLLAGKVGKSVNVEISDSYLNQGLIVSPETIINGDLNYTSNKQAQISEQATVSGKTEMKAPKVKTDNLFADYFWKIIFQILASFLVGLLLIFPLTKLTQKILSSAKEKSLKTLIPGLIAILIIPPISILLAITIIGLPLALILLTAWLIIIYLAPIFSAILLGQFITKKIIKKELPNNFWPLLVGIIIIFLLFSIPYIGWIIKLFAICFGLGGIIFYVTSQSKNI